MCPWKSKCRGRRTTKGLLVKCNVLLEAARNLGTHVLTVRMVCAHPPTPESYRLLSRLTL